MKRAPDSVGGGALNKYPNSKKICALMFQGKATKAPNLSEVGSIPTAYAKQISHQGEIPTIDRLPLEAGFTK